MAGLKKDISNQSGLNLVDGFGGGSKPRLVFLGNVTSRSQNRRDLLGGRCDRWLDRVFG